MSLSFRSGKYQYLMEFFAGAFSSKEFVKKARLGYQQQAIKKPASFNSTGPFYYLPASSFIRFPKGEMSEGQRGLWSLLDCLMMLIIS